MLVGIERRHRSNPNSDGFTLTELLAAVAVLAILAALLFPLAGKALGIAKAAKDIAQLRQIGAIHAQYMGDHVQTAMPGHYPATNEVWFYHYIRPYLGLPLANTAVPLLISPLDHSKGAANSLSVQPMHRRSYAVNRRILKANQQPVRFHELTNPGGMMWIVDFDLNIRNSNWFEPDVAASIAAVPENWISGGYVHLLFLDGHVETLKKTTVVPGGNREDVLGPKL